MRVLTTRISVFGCGYLGAVHAACMAEIGHDVIGIDIDQGLIDALSSGHAPFYEPGLDRLLQRGISSGKLRFSTDEILIRDVDIHFIAVGTPQSRDSGAADTRFINDVIDSLEAFSREDSLVVGKSTVPLGTARMISERLSRRLVRVAWNPEFLREGHALDDTLRPDRIVLGVADGDQRSEDELRVLYRSILETSEAPCLVTNYETAELVKVAANSFLATKISFINAMAEICERVGADVTQLSDAIGYDARIGRRFLNSGLGFGGGCLPKDIRAFRARTVALGVGEATRFLEEIDAINLRRRARVIEILREELGQDLTGVRVTVLGLAFKPHSDDVRDSPALSVASQLYAAGATVTAHDPHALESARAVHPELHYEPQLEIALDGADAVVVLVEWNIYRDFRVKDVTSATSKYLVVDARHCIDVDAWSSAGWVVRRLGVAQTAHGGSTLVPDSLALQLS